MTRRLATSAAERRGYGFRVFREDGSSCCASDDEWLLCGECRAAVVAGSAEGRKVMETTNLARICGCTGIVHHCSAEIQRFLSGGGPSPTTTEPAAAPKPTPKQTEDEREHERLLALARYCREEYVPEATVARAAAERPASSEELRAAMDARLRERAAADEAQQRQRDESPAARARREASEREHLKELMRSRISYDHMRS